MSEPDHVHTDQLPGRTLMVDGAEYLYYSGTSYLGISCNEAFRQCLVEGMRQYGTNYSSSRRSNLRLKVYEEAESYLAAYTGAEAALTMSSGFLAGQTLVQTLQGSGRFLYAPGTHPAVWRSPKDAPNTTHEFEEWVDWLLQEVLAMPEHHIVLVCNSLDPLQARNYSFNWLTSLPPEKQFTLIIDDSHGFGVTGAGGAGIYSQLPQMPHVRLIVVSSFGKAFGIPAGVILGERQLIAALTASPYFGGASPAVPSYLFAFNHCEEVFAEARQKLFYNIAYFRERLERPEMFNFFDHYPVFSTHREDLCAYLQHHHVLISSFRYPTPAHEPITRVILNSLHTSQDLQRLTDLINDFSSAPT
ncbi:pyridoxal phosphate-dependent aminotransferase family protein [Pontibacter diazotrophicus]|uniref:Pyridoxal phosphate-dependent aminotransferase family protein n=1 Tax=Pontibacter diazotrophicus TaxID=1400979 RepID=A0A3D8LD58_9BACT|nr:aminotransferase class I/II-fold pyridoxal phosphate-dependent enzyme [Pontibacter diazotrophicus]RDV15348.1 pyridoxal phosphate-dependent aminotransferase family protein [Pontibacter diazotrophicus]